MPAAPLDLSPYFRVIEDLPGVLDWDEFFGNGRPVELDIGCGRGVFLLKAALEQPDRNFLGLELDYREGRRAARKLQKRHLPNARVIGGDCRIVLRDYVAPASADVAHVLFPDPWWKKKHRRRRLFTDVFVEQLAQVVRPGGVVHSWSDVGDYFEIISALMDHHPQFDRLPVPEWPEPRQDADYRTSFERKALQTGGQVWRGCWRRC